MLKDILPSFFAFGTRVVMTLTIDDHGDPGVFTIAGTILNVSERGIVLNEGDSRLAFVAWAVIGIVRPAEQEASHD